MLFFFYQKDHLKSKLSFDDVDHRRCVFGNKLNFGLHSCKKYILPSKDYLAVLVSTQLTRVRLLTHSANFWFLARLPADLMLLCALLILQIIKDFSPHFTEMTQTLGWKKPQAHK